MYPNINTGMGMAMASALTLNPTTGRVFIVCAASLTAIKPEIDAMYGSGYNDGVPIVFTTLQQAITASVGNRGDIILIAPGHTESIVGAAGIVIATADAGVAIIGLGTGSNRATITFTTAVAASFDINAAGVTIRNVIFTCGIDAQTAMINVTAADVTFDNCVFNTNSGTIGAVLGILTAATATRLQILNSKFMGPAINSGTTTTAQVKHEVGIDFIIQNCIFMGKCTQNILNATTVLGGLIDNNRFVTYTGTKCIAMAAASTPFITNNRINVPSGTTPIVAAAGFVAGNIYSAAAGVTSTGQTGSTATVSTI